MESSSESWDNRIFSTCFPWERSLLQTFNTINKGIFTIADTLLQHITQGLKAFLDVQPSSSFKSDWVVGWHMLLYLALQATYNFRTVVATKGIRYGPHQDITAWKQEQVSHTVHEITYHTQAFQPDLVTICQNLPCSGCPRNILSLHYFYLHIA